MNILRVKKFYFLKLKNFTSVDFRGFVAYIKAYNIQKINTCFTIKTYFYSVNVLFSGPSDRLIDVSKNVSI